MLGFFFSCTKNGGTGYIPYISAPFTDKSSNVNDAYIFTVAEDGAYTSTFTGVEDLNYSIQYSFSGKFTNAKISFTFTSGPKTGSKYSGIISGSGNNEIITLNTPTGKIVLSR
jgi:hypothetical protein